MANAFKKVGAVDLTTTANTVLYQVPANTQAVVNVGLVNRNNDAFASLVRLAISSTTTPANADWIEYDTSLGARQTLERTALALQAGMYLIVRSSVANAVSASAWGMEIS